MSARHVVLVRHGESAWNAIGRLQGQADAPLSELGRDQARALRPVLTALPDLRVATSDLSRACDTAALAGFDGAERDPRWRERSLGIWEGHLEAEVPPRELRAFRTGGHVPEGGETWTQLQARVGTALDDLAARGSWLVFTHGGCVRAAVAHLTGADHRTIVGPENASVTVLELAPRRRLLNFNWSVPQDGRVHIPRGSDPGGAENVSGATEALGSDAGGAAPDHAVS